MMHTVLKTGIALIVLLGIAGCNEESEVTELPKAIAMTEEALGHYCNMNILEHTGPKAQIHLAGIEHPIWFSQVRDAIAYTRLPEETLEASAIYVNDMGKADDWDFPGDDTWINATEAYFVINSSKTGGMGAPEAIPFGTEGHAQAFVKEHGGVLASLEDIPDEYVLAPVDLSQVLQPENPSVN